MKDNYYVLIFLLSATAFVGFNEMILVPYMTAVDYSEIQKKIQEPNRPYIVLFLSMLDFGLICAGTWAGFNLIVMSSDGLTEGPNMIGQVVKAKKTGDMDHA